MYDVVRICATGVQLDGNNDTQDKSISQWISVLGSVAESNSPCRLMGNDGERKWAKEEFQDDLSHLDKKASATNAQQAANLPLCAKHALNRDA